MNRYKIHHLTNVFELRLAAAPWDDLWWRSDVTLPTMRAELLAQWLEQFAAAKDFHALAVEENGRWLAALPLVSRRLAKILPAGTLTSNPWLPCGDLLLDPQADAGGALSALLSAAADLPWPLLWLNDAAVDAPRWRALSAVCREEKMPIIERARYEVAKIEIADDWDAFTKNLSRSQRHNTQKAERRLRELGNLQLEMHSQLAPEEVHSRLEKVFAVEDSSWKGAAGSSVLRTPGMSDFFLRQARQLAEWGQLEIAILQLEGHPIAVLFGFSAKGVYHAHKIGYDPRYSQFSPGQVMFWKILEQLHARGNWKAFDCIGPLTEATSRWRPSTYTIGRMAIAPRRLLGRIALQAYSRFWPKGEPLRENLPAPEPLPEPQDSPAAETLARGCANESSLFSSACLNFGSMGNIRFSC
ncbi:MAG: GNAT family N-acetyltransferase [Pirellulales bacterium]|nr:GNAT family N-acetyltransferase [Pirellulales bacterium]